MATRIHLNLKRKERKELVDFFLGNTDQFMTNTRLFYRNSSLAGKICFEGAR